MGSVILRQKEKNIGLEIWLNGEGLLSMYKAPNREEEGGEGRRKREEEEKEKREEDGGGREEGRGRGG